MPTIKCVAERTGLFQHADVAGMQDIEAAVGEHDPLVFALHDGGALF